LQALYAWNIAQDGPLRQVAGRLWDDMAVGPEERGFAAPLIGLIEQHGEQIEQAVEAVTTNWRMDRIGRIEQCALRLATAELLYGDQPTKAVIQEAVRLTERFASAESARFVNGVLDAVARQHGRL
jgi:N utilization substance protein B